MTLFLLKQYKSILTMKQLGSEPTSNLQFLKMKMKMEKCPLMNSKMETGKKKLKLKKHVILAWKYAMKLIAFSIS